MKTKIIKIIIASIIMFSMIFIGAICLQKLKEIGDNVESSPFEWCICFLCVYLIFIRPLVDYWSNKMTKWLKIDKI